MTHNFKTARKYINVRFGFMKIKLVLAVLMIVTCVILVLGSIDLGPMAADEAIRSLKDEEAILIFIFGLLFIAANLYIFISRIVWMVKYRAADEELENTFYKTKNAVNT